MRSYFIEMETLYSLAKKLHIQELVFNCCPVNFKNTTDKSYIIFLSNEVIT